MSDNITLPREVVQEALEFVTSDRWGTRLYMEGQVYDDAHDLAKVLRTALAAEQPKPEPVAYFDLQKQVFYWARPTMIDVPMTIALEPLPLYAAPPATHPGYIIGSHWLETAYSRICAGEAEADVLRDIGLVREEAFLTGVAHLKAENEALRRDAERYEWAVENAVIETDRFRHDGNDPCSTKHVLDAAIDAAMGDET